MRAIDRSFTLSEPADRHLGDGVSEEVVRVVEQQLVNLVVSRLTEAGLEQSQAEIVAAVLAYADMRGVHSHGVIRVEHYVERIRSGGLNMHPELRVEQLRPSIAVLDAQGGAGHVAMKAATEASVRMSRDEGIGIVGVRNNSHCGALAYYAQMALDAGLLVIVCANTNKGVAPFGGMSGFLGTNPFAFGFPGEADDILLDMATSEVAWGKIMYAREMGTDIPATWAVDREGKPTNRPDQAATLLPFGGAKGYGIGMMVEALTGLLVGGVFGPYVRSMYGELSTFQNLANFVLTIDPGVFGSAESTRKLTQKMIDEIRIQRPGPGFAAVLIPGEIESKNMERSKREGFDIPSSVYNYLVRGN